MAFPSAIMPEVAAVRELVNLLCSYRLPAGVELDDKENAAGRAGSEADLLEKSGVGPRAEYAAFPRDAFDDARVPVRNIMKAAKHFKGEAQWSARIRGQKEVQHGANMTATVESMSTGKCAQ